MSPINSFNAVIFGLIEGITEFLPISSTAHLIIAGRFLHLYQSSFFKFFEVFIQSGAVLAVMFLFFKRLWNENFQRYVYISFIPTGIIGFFAFKLFNKVFLTSFPLLISALAFFGVVFLIVEYLIKKGKIKLTKSIKNITIKDALLIGLFQAIAIIPGVSRAGIVMVAMMLMGYKRDESAVYSFVLAVPTILAASLYNLYQLRGIISFYSSVTSFLFIGFVVSFITALVTVKWLVGYLKKHTLVPFAIYRILLAIILVILLIPKK